jgi:hypothetical protein
MRSGGWAAALLVVLVAASPVLAKKKPDPASAQPAASDDGWRTYSYPKLGFSVELPREPQMHDGQAQTIDGPKPITSYVVDDGEAGGAMVNVTDYGGSGRDPAGLLDMAAQDAAKTLKGTILTQMDIELSGNPGRDVMISVPGGGACDRIIWANGRIYQVLLVGPQTTGAPGSYRTTSSFKLIPYTN